MEKIKTGVWQVRVRTCYNFECLCEKMFFSEKKKNGFVKQIQENVKGIEIFEEFRKCEDFLIYED